MTNDKQIKDLFNATAVDRDGEKLGSVKEVFLDERSGQPSFVEVNHGLFGMSSSLVPLRGHRLNGEELQLAFAKDRISDAPSLDVENGMTPEEQTRIYEHYGLTSADEGERYTDAGAGLTTNHEDRGVEGHKVGETERTAATDRDHVANKGTNNDEMVLSEERMNVSKDKVETGRARLRKYTVTDTESVDVPVTREEVRVERTPIDEKDAANYKGNIGDDAEASVTLHEERVNVSKEEVPVEKVGLSKEQVTETQRHTEELRHEELDTNVEGDRGTATDHGKTDRR